MGRTEGGRKFRPEKGMASMQDYFTDKGKTDILRSTRVSFHVECKVGQPRPLIDP